MKRMVRLGYDSAMAPDQGAENVSAASAHSRVRRSMAPPLSLNSVTNELLLGKSRDCLNGSGIEYLGTGAFHGTGLTNAHHQAFERAASRHGSQNRSEQGPR